MVYSCPALTNSCSRRLVALGSVDSHKIIKIYFVIAIEIVVVRRPRLTKEPSRATQQKRTSSPTASSCPALLDASQLLSCPSCGMHPTASVVPLCGMHARHSCTLGTPARSALLHARHLHLGTCTSAPAPRHLHIRTCTHGITIEKIPISNRFHHQKTKPQSQNTTLPTPPNFRGL